MAAVSGSLGCPYLSCGWFVVGKEMRSFGREVKLKSPIMNVKVGCGELLCLGGR